MFPCVWTLKLASSKSNILSNYSFLSKAFHHPSNSATSTMDLEDFAALNLFIPVEKHKIKYWLTLVHLNKL